jgi:hypothetical protein
MDRLALPIFGPSRKADGVRFPGGTIGISLPAKLNRAQCGGGMRFPSPCTSHLACRIQMAYTMAGDGDRQNGCFPS